MLPQVKTPTPLSTIITCPAAPHPRVEPLLKPLRVQPSHPAHIAPPRVKHAPSTTIDPYTNPCIEVVYNRKKTSPSIPTKPNSDSPRQVQRHLLRTPINDGANFCAQAAQHLVAQHMFNSPYTFHIYNNKVNK